MAGASRLLGTTRALQSDSFPSSFPSSSSCGRPSLRLPWSGGEKRVQANWQGRKRVMVSSEAAVISPEKQQKPSNSKEGARTVVDLSSFLVAEAVRVALKLFRPSQPTVVRKCWRLQAEMLVERGIIGCRSFSLIAVAGSLIGSVLCFVEGCFLILESFFQYFHAISQRVDQGGILRLLIEAIDMFLVGTALLTFGMGLYVMFAGSNEIKQRKGWVISESNFFGAFDLKRLPACREMQSISHAKSSIGQAVVMILQAGVLDKFKNVPLVSGLDLACFAGAVLVSSACVFLLSRLTMKGNKSTCI